MKETQEELIRTNLLTKRKLEELEEKNKNK